MIPSSYLFNVTPGNWAGSNPGKVENSESLEIVFFLEDLLNKWK